MSIVEQWGQEEEYTLEWERKQIKIYFLSSSHAPPNLPYINGQENNPLMFISDACGSSKEALDGVHPHQYFALTKGMD